MNWALEAEKCAFPSHACPTYVSCAHNHDHAAIGIVAKYPHNVSCFVVDGWIVFRSGRGGGVRMADQVMCAVYMVK